MPTDWAALVVGAVGAVTGLVSLLWHILNARTKLQVEVNSIEFRPAHGTRGAMFGLQIIARNIGGKHATVEWVSIAVEGAVLFDSLNHQGIDIAHMPRHLTPGSSEPIHLQIKVSKTVEELLSSQHPLLKVTVHHTFGQTLFSKVLLPLASSSRQSVQ